MGRTEDQTAQGLIAITASWLRENLSAWGSGALPTLDHLCKSRGVGRNTMRAAVGLLVREGVLEAGRGRRVRAASVSGAAPPSTTPTGADRCLAAIRERIVSGHYRRGRPLPKAAFLSRDIRTSNRSVIQALRTLANERLIHKAGKAWYVGPTPVRAAAAPPVIVVIHRTPTAWVGLYNDRTGGFPRTFAEEANAAGVRLVSVLETVERSNGASRVAGTDACVRFVSSLGDRYLGACLVSSSRESPSLPKWLDLLGRFGRPLVWFDRYGEGMQWLGSLRNKRLVLWAHFVEGAGEECAVSFLSDRGHRTICYAGWSQEAWVRRRLELLRLAGNREGVTVCGADQIGVPAPQDSRSLVDGLAAMGLVGRVRRDRVLWALTEPHHANMLRYMVACLLRGATAVVARNDQEGKMLLNILYKADLAVPDGLSVLSFDNGPQSDIMSLSSVDFGFGGLGYASFHAILGDLPVTRSGRTLHNRPAVVDRGSVAMRTEKPRSVPGCLRACLGQS